MKATVKGVQTLAGIHILSGFRYIAVSTALYLSLLRKAEKNEIRRKWQTFD